MSNSRVEELITKKHNHPNSIHMKTWLYPILISLSLIVTSLRADAPQLENSRVRTQLDEMQGKPAPKLALKDWINSKPLTLKDLKGKIIVLDFWATWCGPCLAAIPHTNEMMENYADKGVVFIGVCAQRGAEKMADTVKQGLPASWPGECTVADTAECPFLTRWRPGADGVAGPSAWHWQSTGCPWRMPHES